MSVIRVITSKHGRRVVLVEPTQGEWPLAVAERHGVFGASAQVVGQERKLSDTLVESCWTLFHSHRPNSIFRRLSSCFYTSTCVCVFV